MSRIILGLDPGIADTGFGVIKVFEDGRMNCLEYGSIRTSPKENLAERLEKLFCDLEEIINKYRPQIISIEELFFNKNVKTALIVGQARGVIMLAVKRSGAKFFEFTPIQIKQSISTYGRADKAQVQRMVKMVLKLSELPRPNDAADALAAAICASNRK